MLSLLWALGVAAVAGRLMGTHGLRHAHWAYVFIPLLAADALGIVCGVMLTCKALSISVDHGPSMRKAARAWLWNNYFGLMVYSLTVGGLGGLAFKLILSNSLDSNRNVVAWGLVSPLLVQSLIASACWLAAACKASPPRR